jgi:hypothetical protein
MENGQLEERPAMDDVMMDVVSHPTEQLAATHTT